MAAALRFLMATSLIQLGASTHSNRTVLCLDLTGEYRTTRTSGGNGQRSMIQEHNSCRGVIDSLGNYTIDQNRQITLDSYPDITGEIFGDKLYVITFSNGYTFHFDPNYEDDAARTLLVQGLVPMAIAMLTMRVGAA